MAKYNGNNLIGEPEEQDFGCWQALFIDLFEG